MTDTSFTLLEIHLEEGAVRIGTNGLLGGEDAGEGAADRETDEATPGDADGGTLGCGPSARSIGAALAVVALLAALGVAAARLLDDGDLEDAAEIDDLGA
jgi:hypothetical protein